MLRTLIGFMKKPVNQYTTEQWITKASFVHNNKYDYSKVDYKGGYTDIIVICPEHGETKQKPATHLLGKGCPLCKNIYFISKEEFLEKAIQKHNNRYDYSKVDIIYKENKPIEIVCKIHGPFFQNKSRHLLGSNCPKCVGSGVFYTTKDWIEKAVAVHGDRYDYSKVDYVNSKSKVNIICKKHGEFSVIAAAHISKKRKTGCRKCNMYNSLGEQTIEKYLNSKNIEHKMQIHFKHCNSVCDRNRSLFFDFYLPQYNLVIEFDGEQHFRSVNHFGGETSFKKRKDNDIYKNKYCRDNNIKLLRIGYYEFDDIEQILKDWLPNIK